MPQVEKPRYTTDTTPVQPFSPPCAALCDYHILFDPQAFAIVASGYDLAAIEQDDDSDEE